MATRRSRTFTPNAYARPNVTIKERPQVTITPRPEIKPAEEPPLELSTLSGCTQEVKVVDEAGAPIVGATVDYYIMGWSPGGVSLPSELFTKVTDSNGKITFEADGGYWGISARKEGYGEKQLKWEKVCEPPITLTLIAEATGKTYLDIRSTPAGAEVVMSKPDIPSAAIAGTTPFVKEVTANEAYILAFTLDNYEPKEITNVIVEIAGETEVVTVTLEPIGIPLQKIDVILFTLPPSCAIGDRCEGEIVLKNNTDGTLSGIINIGMEGAIPVPPTTYSIPAGETQTGVFGIPTEGLTIVGTYVLELEMMVGTEVVESATGKLEILSPPAHEVTFTSAPATATVVVTEL